MRLGGLVLSRMAFFLFSRICFCKELVTTYKYLLVDHGEDLEVVVRLPDVLFEFCHVFGFLGNRLVLKVRLQV